MKLEYKKNSTNLLTNDFLDTLTAVIKELFEELIRPAGVQLDGQDLIAYARLMHVDEVTEETIIPKIPKVL